MAFIEEYPGDAPQAPTQFVQLPHRLRADERMPTLMHRIPQKAAVLGHAAGQRISLAIVLDLGHRAEGADVVLTGRVPGWALAALAFAAGVTSPVTTSGYSSLVPLVIAKGALAVYCGNNAIPFEPFTDFAGATMVLVRHTGLAKTIQTAVTGTSSASTGAIPIV